MAFLISSIAWSLGRTSLRAKKQACMTVLMRVPILAFSATVPASIT